MNYVSDKVKNLPFSVIRKFFDIAGKMEDVVSLGIGEPDFFTPWHIREEAIDSLKTKRTIYTPNAGLPELRKEICGYLSAKYSLNYDYNKEIIVTVGVSEAIDLVLRAVINDGDEVLLIEPCFLSYRPCIIMAGGVPVVITTSAENGFRVTADDIAEKITDKTKAIVLCYPNNPTGAIMEKEDLEEIAGLLREKDILVISDEVYSELTYGERAHVSIASLEGMSEKTMILNGFSKSFAMTGWRLGYACGPEEIVEAMIKIHQNVAACAPVTAQYAGIDALKNSDDDVAQMRAEYDARRKFLYDGFNRMGLDCFEPLGAFYMFPSIKKTGLTSDEFCSRLLNEGHVAAVPGTAFGECGEGFIRCSYACSMEKLNEAVIRIGGFMEKL